jgi:hypothetical protein
VCMCGRLARLQTLASCAMMHRCIRRTLSVHCATSKGAAALGTLSRQVQSALVFSGLHGKLTMSVTTWTQHSSFRQAALWATRCTI